MINKNTREKGISQILCIDDLVPREHLVRKLDAAIDFDFIYDEVKDLYCEDNGRPSVDPVTLFKLVFVQYTFGIRSMRQTIKEVEVNVAYRWFCNLDIMDAVPHFSTFSKNYERRFASTNIFERIFDKILSECVKHGFVNSSTVCIDSTHIKANANKRKKVEKFVAVERKNYQNALDMEIAEVRKSHGRKPPKNNGGDSGGAGVITATKKITKSTTDADAGEFHKGEHEKCFAYSAHTATDKHGFILKTVVTAGNLHDSRMFSDVYQSVISKHDVENVAVDAGYKTPAICKEIIDSGKLPIMPYTCPKGQVNLSPNQPKKKEYTYCHEEDCFVSPTGQIFRYSTTDKDGYSVYKCKGSKRVLTRHVWQNYVDIANIIRLTPHGKQTYAIRKESVERVFADAKEKHAMRWTTLRGLQNLKRQVTLTFACMNLKKMANWLWKTPKTPLNPLQICSIFSKIAVFLTKIFSTPNPQLQF